MMGRKAAGFIEARGYLAAVEAADVCVKSANIKIVGLEKLSGGLWTVIISGDVGAVKAAVTAGVAAVKSIGEVISSHVIPRPASGLDNVCDITLPLPKAPESKVSESIGVYPQVDVESTEPAIEESVSTEEKQTPVQDETIESQKPEQIDIPHTAFASSSDSSKVSSITYEGVTEEELYACRTVDLRKMARNIKDIGISGKNIKFARKNELVKAILASWQNRD